MFQGFAISGFGSGLLSHRVGALLVSAFAVSALAAIPTGIALADSAPVPVSASTLYVPAGFDSNDEVVVVIDGRFADTCWQLTSPAVVVNAAAMEVLITPRAYQNPGPCVVAPVPWDQEVAVGELAAGDWTVRISSSGQHEALPVGVASTTGPDDFLYAPVQTAQVVRTEAGGYKAILTGRLFASCLAWKESRLIDQGKIQVVLPIIEQVSNTCQAASTEFTQEIMLSSGLSAGRHLLHVRSLNGKALNVLFLVQ